MRAAHTLNPAGPDGMFPGPDLLFAILGIIALKNLSHSGHLTALDCIRSVRAEDCKAAVFDASSLQHLALCLRDRLVRFCPQSVTNDLTTAEPPSPASLLDLWGIFSDTQLSAHWSDERSLGYAYQFLCAPARRASQDDIQSANKSVGLDQVIAFTQLYTPRWVVDYLLEQTVLRQWSGNTSSSRCRNTKPAAELQLIDPACGAGHFLLPAFDLFLNMHRMEGTPPAEAVGRILNHNLAGVDIDRSALSVTSLALLLKSLKTCAGTDFGFKRLATVLSPDESNGRSLLGTLDRAWSAVPGHPLSECYDAVVANPPYIGRKLLPRDLKAQLKVLYPASHQDLCAAFVQRSLELLKPGGQFGFIGQASLLHLPTYRDLRQHLVERETLIAVVEAGPGVFPLQTGEKVNSALVVVERSEPAEGRAAGNVHAKFVDLTSEDDKATALNTLPTDSSGSMVGKVYSCDPRNFRYHPRYAFAYKCPPAVQLMVQSADKLGTLAEVRQGLATTDNKRFLRYWWDVSPQERGTRWFPYVKGAGSERWYSPNLHVVNWANDGADIKTAVSVAYPYLKGKSGWVVKNEQFYFQEGLTFSFVNARTLAIRRLPAGCIFDVGGSALFADEETLDFLLAYLNSSVMTAIARMLNPTINFQVGDIRDLPVAPFSQRIRNDVAQIGRECYRLKRDLLRFNPTSGDAVIPKEVLDIANGADIGKMWTSLSPQLDSTVRELKGLETQLSKAVLASYLHMIEADAITTATVSTWVDAEAEQTALDVPFADSKSFAEVIIQFLIRVCLERRSAGWAAPATCQARCDIEDVPVLLPATANGKLCQILGLTAASRAWLEQQLNSSITKYLADRFMSMHSRAFRGSPLYVCLRLPQNDLLLLASSRVIRQRNHKLPDPAAQAIIEDIANQLSPIADWTGADLFAILRRKGLS